MSDRLSDEQVAWHLRYPNADAQRTALAREVHELRADKAALNALLDENDGVIAGLRDERADLRAEVERLTAENTEARNEAHHAWATLELVGQDYRSERALADQLAEALRAAKTDRPTAHSDDVWAQILAALAAWEAARHE